MPLVHVGLGSNIDPHHNLRRAVRALGEAYGRLILSPVYGSPAVGLEGEDFLNAVAGLHTDQGLEQLWQELRELETLLGRERPGGSSWTSRTIDLDLLTYGDLTWRQGQRQLPSPDILTYAFVLWPLADIAGSWTHPEEGRTLDQLRQHLELTPAATKVTLDLTPASPPAGVARARG